MNEDQVDADFMAWARETGAIANITTAHELGELHAAYKAGYGAGLADAEDAIGRPLN